MDWDYLAYKFYWLRDNFLLVARSDHITGSRNIKPEVVFKVQKMAQYALFCQIMRPFKGKCVLFARLWPVRSSTVGHPSNSWASCFTSVLFLSVLLFLFYSVL